MHYYLGLDNGGTTTKASIYNSIGEEIATVSTDTRMFVPRPGFTERDMEQMWQANCQVVRDVISKAGIPAVHIRCVAICGHGKGLYLWDKSGNPSRPGIISTDRRAQNYVDRWKKDGTEDKVFARSAQHILPFQPVALLAWLRDNEPESLKNLQYIFSAKDYIRFRMTGEAFAEFTDYSGNNLINLSTRDYDEELLSLFGLKEFGAALPPLRRSTDICGAVTDEAALLTGLKAGTPVAGGMFDIDACALAVDAVREEHLCMIAGTWSINEYVSPVPVTNGKVLMNSLFCMPEYYLIEESSPTSAGNNEWFIKTMLPELSEDAKKKGTSVYALMNQMAASLSAETICPIFHPFLMASNMDPNALGALIGLSNYHTRAHIVRGIYEGIAFGHRYHYEKLLATRSMPPEEIHLAGGAAKSEVWTQIFADVMNIPVRTSSACETGTLGCCIAAAVACGDYADIKTAAMQMTNLSDAVMPDPTAVESYNKKYACYLRFADALSEAWAFYHKNLG